MSYTPVDWVQHKTPINEYHLDKMETGIVEAHEALADHEEKINKFANNQMPEEYLKKSVDNYVNEHSAGFATDAKLEETESRLSGQIEESVSTLSSEIANNSDRLVSYDGFIFPLMEIGALNISNTGWKKLDSKTRVRTVNPIPLLKGDIIHLSDYTNARMYIGYQKEDGTYSDSVSWQTNDWSVPYDGLYVITISNITEVEISGVNVLSDLLSVYRTQNKLFEIEKIKEDRIMWERTTFEKGSINYVNGSEVESETRLRSGFLYLYKGDIVYSANPYLYFAVQQYDVKKKNVGQLWSWDKSTSILKFVIPTEGYYRITLRKSDNSAFTDSEVMEYSKSIIVCNELGEKNHTYKRCDDRNALNISLHRGFWATSPENTLEAFREGYRRGFKFMETDIWFTSDNVPVICHDETVNRTSNGTGKITDMTLEQLKALDFGSYKGAEFEGVKIPTFEETVIDAKRYGYGLIAEIKSISTVEQVTELVNIVKKYSMQKSVKFNSFTDWALKQIHFQDSTIGLYLEVEEITESKCLEVLGGDYKSDNDTMLMISADKVTDGQLDIAFKNSCPIYVFKGNCTVADYEDFSMKYVSELLTDYFNPSEVYF